MLQHMCRIGLVHTEDCPCAHSTVLSPLQRNQTGPQSPEHILQFCPLFRETRQDHSPQSTFYSSVPSAEKPDRTTVPRAHSTVLFPHQKSEKAPRGTSCTKVLHCEVVQVRESVLSHQGVAFLKYFKFLFLHVPPLRPGIEPMNFCYFSHDLSVVFSPF